MQEAFLHHLWKYQKLNTPLKTTTNALVQVKHTGQQNMNAGPDFFNAQLLIDGQLWAGNVEIHVKSSDWYVHRHEKDKAYDNVILHVVWEHDTEVFRRDNSKIPTLVVQHYVQDLVFENYKSLMYNTELWINCEKDFNTVETFKVNNWLERLYFERLEQKAEQIVAMLQATQNDWEAILFESLARNFGLNINGDAFQSMANSIDFKTIRKLQNGQLQLEALFFGQANLLETASEATYYHQLKKRYGFLKQKYNLNTEGITPVKFFRLRPNNFPTIRLSQLASLYSKYQNLFSQCMAAKTISELYEIFDVATSAYWKQHYTFGTTSKLSVKKISKAFKDLLIVNTIVPVKFAYAKSLGRDEHEHLLDMMLNLDIEKNKTVDRFLALKPLTKNAMTSQALLQLKLQYCDRNKCMQCAVGSGLILKK